MHPYASGENQVVDISRAPFSEIFFTDDEEADTYYKLKANFISLDEKTGKEKKVTHCFLVQGSSTQNAQYNFDVEMGKTMIGYTVGAIIETKIMDIFLH